MNQYLATWPQSFVFVSYDKKSLIVYRNPSLPTHLPIGSPIHCASTQGQFYCITLSDLHLDGNYLIDGIHGGFDFHGNSELYILAHDTKSKTRVGTKQKKDLFCIARGKLHNITNGSFEGLTTFAQQGNSLFLLDDKGNLYFQGGHFPDYKFYSFKAVGPFQKIECTKKYGVATHLALSDRAVFIGTKDGAIFAKKIHTSLNKNIFNDKVYIESPPDWVCIYQPESPRIINSLQVFEERILVSYRDNGFFSNDDRVIPKASPEAVAIKSFSFEGDEHLFLHHNGQLSGSESMMIRFCEMNDREKNELSCANVVEFSHESRFSVILMQQPGRELRLYVRGEGLLNLNPQNSVTIVNPRGSDEVLLSTIPLLPPTSSPRLPPVGMPSPVGSRSPSPPPSPTFMRPRALSHVSFDGLPIVLQGGPDYYERFGPHPVAAPPRPAIRRPCVPVDMSTWSCANNIAVWDNGVAVIEDNERHHLHVRGAASDFSSYHGSASAASEEDITIFDFRSIGHIHSIYSGVSESKKTALFVLVHTQQEQLLFVNEEVASEYITGFDAGEKIAGLPFVVLVKNRENLIKSISISQNYLACVGHDNNLYVNRSLLLSLGLGHSGGTPLSNIPLWPVTNLSGKLIGGSVNHAALNSKFLYLATADGTIFYFPLSTQAVPTVYKFPVNITVTRLRANESGAYFLLNDGAIYFTGTETIINDKVNDKEKYVTAESLTLIPLPPRFYSKPYQYAIVANYAVALTESGELSANRYFKSLFPKIGFTKRKEDPRDLSEEVEPMNFHYQFSVIKEDPVKFTKIYFSSDELFVAVLLNEGSEQTILIHFPLKHRRENFSLTDFSTQKSPYKFWNKLIINNVDERTRFIGMIQEGHRERSVNRKNSSHMAVGSSGATWLSPDQKLLARGERATTIFTGMPHPLNAVESLSFQGLIQGSHNIEVLDLAIGENYAVALFNDTSLNASPRRYARITGDFTKAPLGRWREADNGIGWHTLF